MRTTCPLTSFQCDDLLNCGYYSALKEIYVCITTQHPEIQEFLGLSNEEAIEARYPYHT